MSNIGPDIVYVKKKAPCFFNFLSLNFKIIVFWLTGLCNVARERKNSSRNWKAVSDETTENKKTPDYHF